MNTQCRIQLTGGGRGELTMGEATDPLSEWRQGGDVGHILFRSHGVNCSIVLDDAREPEGSRCGWLVVGTQTSRIMRWRRGERRGEVVFEVSPDDDPEPKQESML